MESVESYVPEAFVEFKKQRVKGEDDNDVS